MRMRLKQLRALLNVMDPDFYQFLSECSLSVCLCAECAGIILCGSLAVVLVISSC